MAVRDAPPTTLGQAGPLTRLSESRLRTAIALVILCAVLFLPGFFAIPPVDRDEALFAQATKQMVETGDYVDIRVQDQPRHKKPIGIYWLQAAAVSLSGQGAEAPIWVYRLPSLLGAVAAVLGLAFLARPLVGARGALLAAIMLASCIVLSVEARLAKTDAVLLAAVVLAQGVLVRAHLGLAISRAHFFLFWAALAGGILVKGPIILMVVGLTALALSVVRRSGRWLLPLRPLPGLALAALLVLPWFVAIMSASEGAFLGASVGDDMFAKLFQGRESHGAPPGAHTLAMLGVFWPFAPLVVLAAPFVWRNRRLPEVAFCLAWLLPCWVIFELVATKLPHYVMPLYPALSILIVLAIAHGGMALERAWMRVFLWLIPAGALLVPLGANGLLVWLDGTVSLLGLVLGACAAGLGVASRRLFAAADWNRAILTACASACLLYAAVYGAIFPRLSTIWVVPRLEAAVQRLSDCGEPMLASAGFDEPSVVFMLGTETRLVGGADAAEFLAPGGCRLALVEARREQDFLERMSALGVAPDLLDRVQGREINGGHALEIGIYRP